MPWPDIPSPLRMFSPCRIHTSPTRLTITDRATHHLCSPISRVTVSSRVDEAWPPRSVREERRYELLIDGECRGRRLPGEDDVLVLPHTEIDRAAGAGAGRRARAGRPRRRPGPRPEGRAGLLVRARVRRAPPGARRPPRRSLSALPPSRPLDREDHDGDHRTQRHRLFLRLEELIGPVEATTSWSTFRRSAGPDVATRRPPARAELDLASRAPRCGRSRLYAALGAQRGRCSSRTSAT